MSEHKYRIFISSPSDCGEYRKIAKDVVNSLNEFNAMCQFGLVPVTYEVHAQRGQGAPQDRINELLEYCDLGIAIFNARLGTKTAEYDSGTLEEIDRLRKDGKQVITFFKSHPLLDPFNEDYDAQWKKLCEYKNQAQQSEFYVSFEGADDFRSNLESQLIAHINTLEENYDSQSVTESKGQERFEGRTNLPKALLSEETISNWGTFINAMNNTVRNPDALN